MTRWAARILGALTAALLPALACAQAPVAAPTATLEAPPVPAPAAASADNRLLEAYVDGMVESAMRTQRIAGVGVGVVRGGEVLLLKGYGVADTRGRRVDPERTLFRIASISKTFTWIALMQQVEAGRIDLEKPVNNYLPAALHIPDDGYTQPVLVRHLITHSAGFEDIVAGHLFIEDPGEALPLVDALVRHRPHRVRPPGVAAVYSNYGVALAGAIVAQVTGQPFEDYVEQRVLAPLGLQNTTFREPYGPALAQARGLPSPMSPALAGDLSDGFSWRGGVFVRRPFEHVVQFAPAGSVSSTPADMTRYLTALLTGGAGVLRPETMALFAQEKPFFANAPGVNGVAFGMLQSRSDGGWRRWGHGGDTVRFHSDLAVFPDLDLGVFVTTNSENGGALRDLVADRIADRIAGPNPAPAAPLAAPPLKDLSRFAGVYLVDRRGYTTIERAFCLVRCALEISVSGGQLVLAGGGGAARLAPVDSIDRGKGLLIHRFRNPESGLTSAFEERDGRIVHYISASGVNRATKISRFLAPEGFFALLLVGILAALAALFSGLSRLFSAHQPGSTARLVGLLVPLAGLAWLITLGLYGAYFQQAAADDWVVFAHWPGSLRPGAYASIAAATLTGLAVLALVVAWGRSAWSVWRRTRLVATLCGLVALAIALNGWNLLGLRF
jgi:CubicO group peptidase (beta-lactamase class C family)